VSCPAASRRRREQPRLELADVFRQCGDRLLRLDGRQSQVVRAILRCRTAVLGGHVQQCDRCNHREISYNSCRDRHCPKCQGNQQRHWFEAQQQLLLPIEYHHVVFTVPDTLHVLFRAQPRLTYGLLFAAVAETLHDAAGNPRHLGAKIGFSCVLHTWTQTLLYHPHVHCIVTGGGLDPDHRRWVAARPGFLFPVRVLGRLFRGKLLHRLEQCVDAKKLHMAEGDPHARLRIAARKDWVVYSKPPFAGPEQVLRYLGRYTHRIAISNHRLVALEDDRVIFRYNNRARGKPNRLMTLDVVEFVRRFLLHVLPTGLMRIRHYGLLANAKRQRDLARCRQCIEVETLKDHAEHANRSEPPIGRCHQDLVRCPRCRVGHLVTVGLLPAPRARSP
jgi:hypothetical protein